MLSKGLIKLVNSLNHKKYRDKYKLFVAEGEKLVSDLLKMDAPITTIVTSKVIANIPRGVEIIRCKISEISKISFLKTSPDVLALVKIIDSQLDIDKLYGKLSIALDGIQDPGNMGTITRLANWFGIENILCSLDCADIYNPKVVQASMGAIMGVKVFYVDLEDSIKKLLCDSNYKIFGTYMQGESLYKAKLDKNALLVMGSEGNGISENIEKLISLKISIPAFQKNDYKAESLNVGVATGIIISEFIRQSVV